MTTYTIPATRSYVLGFNSNGDPNAISTTSSHLIVSVEDGMDSIRWREVDAAEQNGGYALEVSAGDGPAGAAHLVGFSLFDQNEPVPVNFDFARVVALEDGPLAGTTFYVAASEVNDVLTLDYIQLAGPEVQGSPFFPLYQAGQDLVGFPAASEGDPILLSSFEGATRTEDDVFDGTSEADIYRLGAGNDVVNGGRGDDTLEGMAGGDSLSGGRGADSLLGGGGGDELSGRAGDDALVGGGRGDTLRGGGGDDELEGRAGADALLGGGGDDTLLGGGGADLLRAGDGDDLLSGGGGRNRLIGGEGADDFVLSGRGRTAIRDFELGVDSLDMSGFSRRASDLEDLDGMASEVRGGVRFADGAGAVAIVADVTLEELLSDIVMTDDPLA